MNCDGITEALYKELSRPERSSEPFLCKVCRTDGAKRFTSDDLNAMVREPQQQDLGTADEDEGEEKPVAEAWKPPADLFSTLFAIKSWYGTRPFLGTRSRDAAGKLGPYSWMTYDEAWAEASALGAGLMELQLVQPGEYVGIMSINRKEWVVTDWACVQYNFVSVPLVVTLDAETLVFVLNQAEVRCVVLSADLAQRVLAVAAQCPLLRGLVVMDDVAPLPPPPPERVSVHTYRQALAAGEHTFPGDYAGRLLRRPQDLMTIIYTSGSTGMPKVWTGKRLLLLLLLLLCWLLLTSASTGRHDERPAVEPFLHARLSDASAMPRALVCSIGARLGATAHLAGRLLRRRVRLLQRRHG